MPKTVPIEPGFLKVGQIARELNVSDKHVRRLIARGERLAGDADGAAETVAGAESLTRSKPACEAQLWPLNWPRLRPASGNWGHP